MPDIGLDERCFAAPRANFLAIAWSSGRGGPWGCCAKALVAVVVS